MNGYLLLLALIYDVALVAVCLFALVRGGRPERVGAIVNLVASIMTIALRWLRIATGAPAEIIVLVIDLAVALSFLRLATKSIRFWPIWAFGFALADIVVSVTGALLPNTPFIAYHTTLGIYAYLALAALAIGTYRLPRDAPPDQRRGHRPPWKSPTQT
jgi:hypothetical protein